MEIVNSKEYLEIRRRQDALLSEISGSTPADDPKIKEVLSLQDKCDVFERNNFHVDGYEEISVELPTKILIELVRLSHAAGMNVSDFISMAIREYISDEGEFSWTTDIRAGEGVETRNGFLTIPDSILNELGWEAGDFLRVTVKDGSLEFCKVNFE